MAFQLEIHMVLALIIEGNTPKHYFQISSAESTNCRKVGIGEFGNLYPLKHHFLHLEGQILLADFMLNVMTFLSENTF